MTTEQIASIVKIGLYAAGAFAIISMLIRFIVMEYRLHRRDRAPIETAPATVFHKHPDMEPVLAGRGSTYVYYITFHTDSGIILKLYMPSDQYHILEEGDHGILTWQRERFWKFEKEE